MHPLRRELRYTKGMKKEHIAGIILIIAILGLVWWQTSANSSVTYTPTPTSNTGTSTSQTFTMAEVATHNNAQSCYSVIDGSVYDLTKWINQHSGGPEAILSICGIDGSSAFHGQ